MQNTSTLRRVRGGRGEPDQYSADLSLFVLDAGSCPGAGRAAASNTRRALRGRQRMLRRLCFPDELLHQM